MSNKKEAQSQQTQAIISTCLVASLTILKEQFNFTQEQLSNFSEQYIPTITKVKSEWDRGNK